MTNKQEQRREAEIQHPTEEEIARAHVIWNSGRILGLHVQAEDAIVAAGVLLAAARAREAALRDFVAQVAMLEPTQTEMPVVFGHFSLQEITDQARLLLSAASAPAEAGREEGGAEG